MYNMYYVCIIDIIIRRKCIQYKNHMYTRILPCSIIIISFHGRTGAFEVLVRLLELLSCLLFFQHHHDSSAF